MSDPLQHRTTYVYDGSRRPQAAGGNATTSLSGRDAAGNPLPHSVVCVYTDGPGLTTTHTYDSSGHPIPEGKSEPPAPDVSIDPEG